MIKIFIYKDKVPEWVEKAPFELFFMQPATVVWKFNGSVHVAPVLPILGGIFKNCIMYAPDTKGVEDIVIQGAPTCLWNTWSLPKVWIRKIFNA